jgi:hypothetical protein
MATFKELKKSLQIYVAYQLGYCYAVNLTNNKLHKLHCRHLKNAHRIKIISRKKAHMLLEEFKVSVCGSCID